MKTTMMAGVCLLALVLTFTIAECGPSEQLSCDEMRQICITRCDERYNADQCKNGCVMCSFNSTSYNSTSYEGSGATAIAGATIFSTISALLVAVASAMN